MPKRYKMNGSFITIKDAVRLFILQENSASKRWVAGGNHVRWVPKWKIEKLGQSLGCLAETATREARRLVESDREIICHQVDSISHYAPCVTGLIWYNADTGRKMTVASMKVGNKVFSEIHATNYWIVIMVIGDAFVASSKKGTITSIFRL